MMPGQPWFKSPLPCFYYTGRFGIVFLAPVALSLCESSNHMLSSAFAVLSVVRKYIYWERAGEMWNPRDSNQEGRGAQVLVAVNGAANIVSSLLCRSYLHVEFCWKVPSLLDGSA